MLTAARDAGLSSVNLVLEPLAAAVGADLPIGEPNGTMIVECGAGTTEVAVLSLGGICVTRSVRVGGASLDHAIADHLHFRHKFLIGSAQTVAEQAGRLVEASGVNYLAGAFSWGTLTREQQLRSIDLFDRVVIPAVRERLG